MRADLDTARRSLQTIESRDPRELRLHALTALQRPTEADDVAFQQFRMLGDTVHYTAPLATSALGRQVYRRLEGRVGYETVRHQVNPRPAEVNRFIGQDYLGSRASREGRPTIIPMPIPPDHPLQREIYGPLGARDENRILLFDGPRLLGRLSLTFQSLPRAGYRKPALPNQLVPELVALFTAADRLQNAELDGRAQFVVRPNGVIAYASTGGERWLTGERRALIASVVRRADRGPLDPVTIIDGAALTLVRMHGSDVVYLAMVSAAKVPELTADHTLTPRQREIAEYAVAGATNVEIAATLRLSPDTVHDHMKAIYQRLGVACRAELVRVLQDGR